MAQDTRRRSSSSASGRTKKSSTSRSGSSRSSRSTGAKSSASRTRSRSTSGRHHKGKRAAARKRRRILLFAAEALVLVCLVGVLYVVSKMDRMQGQDLASAASSEDTEDLSQVTVQENQNLSAETTQKLEKFTNVALFGVDSRTGILGKGSRSDTIIIASINNETKEVKLCSIYRDTYLNLTNGNYNKANSAYAFGGPDQAINMLNLNLDLNISKYVSVDFTAIANAVDALGGIEMEVNEAEYEHLNNYTVETSEVVGRTTTKLPGPGTYNLDGIQAVSYCRIRYTKGDDFKRAERQRTVIAKIVEKAKEKAQSGDLATINKIITDMFPQVATNLKVDDVLSMTTDLLSYNIVDSSGFPFDKTTGTFGSKGSCVVAADLISNVEQLHTFLFGSDENYTVSDKVKEISAKITNDTGVTAKEQ